MAGLCDDSTSSSSHPTMLAISASTTAFAKAVRSPLRIASATSKDKSAIEDSVSLPSSYDTPTAAGSAAFSALADPLVVPLTVRARGRGELTLVSAPVRPPLTTGVASKLVTLCARARGGGASGLPAWRFMTPSPFPMLGARGRKRGESTPSALLRSSSEFSMLAELAVRVRGRGRGRAGGGVFFAVEGDLDAPGMRSGVFPPDIEDINVNRFETRQLGTTWYLSRTI
mmetsp:Transcript_46454/g.93766  ORF Transcript_46454/g.93766 Transcript_46454/m.93766 type:complete len:228 (-) Transcript_46454:63-746(-)